MPAQVLTPTPENIALAAAALLAGDVVAMPTETVYGLAGVVFDETALTKIFSVKERPTFDPLICHVAEKAEKSMPWLTKLNELQLVDAAALSTVARDWAERLMSALWPGPVTLVLPKQASVPDLATSALPTVAVRCPRHPVAQALLQAVGRPLAAPSANRFGRISPTIAAHVLSELGERIPYIIDGGSCDVGIESTVLLIEPEGRVWQLRPGGMSPLEIARATGVQVEQRTIEGVASSTPVPSPGLLASHYAPRKPLRLIPTPLAALASAELQALLETLPPAARLGILLAQGDARAATTYLQRSSIAMRSPTLVFAQTLSAAGDLTESAQRLFAALRELDENPQVDFLWSELVVDDGGLGYAINDRLRRASHP